MTPKQKILNCLTKDYLQEIAAEYELTGMSQLNKGELVTALSRKRSVNIEDILNGLSLDDLKTVCRGMDMDDAGRKKADMVDRLLGRDAEENGIARKKEKPSQNPMFDMETKDRGKRKKGKRPPKSGSKDKRAAGQASKDYCQYRHNDTRANNPPVGLVTPESDPDGTKQVYQYDPHLDPALQFDCGRSQVENLIDDALASDDPADQRQALEELKRLQTPYLNWAGKAERTSFELDTVSLHVHERIDPFTILQSAGRPVGERPHQQMDLFEPAFENLPLREAIDFYKHQHGWANRLVAGDSLLVMNSLLQKEGMAGKVQMIYIDPPYGIKYGSNFQPFVNKRDVKDRSDQDLTQEPEMIKAFRDTWELGIHSYLTYLRDRLLLAKELLNESGSVFVQISDENLQFVRNIMGEILGEENFVSIITIRKTGAVSSPDARLNSLGAVSDFVVWYAKEKSKLKYRQLFLPKQEVSENQYRLSDEFGNYQSVSFESNGYAESFHFPIKLFGNVYKPADTRHWSTTETGIYRTKMAGRILRTDKKIRFKKYLKDFPVVPIANLWGDLMGASGLIYVVQTNTRIIERCLLMATDPGDLVIDPTCGSGTTAFVAEKWGRRWITCDTSRVAIALAKQRLMTAAFECYYLKYEQEGVKGGFDYKTVPHITLKSIANNPEIDEIYAGEHPKIEQALADLNQAVKGNMQEWEVPFDFNDDWLDAARTAFDAFHKSRQSMQKKMDQSIGAHADQEILYDQPKVDKSKTRISGPFTVEAVPCPTVLSLDDVEAPKDADCSVARSGESARQHEWRDELLKTGIRGKGGQKIELAELETLSGTRHLHAVGMDKEKGDRIAVSFGPEFAPLEQRQVELALEEAGNLRPKVKMVIFAAFSFDPEAAKDIDEINWPGVTVLKVQMNTDLLTEDLKSKRASNESFWLMGQPDVSLAKTAAGFAVEVHGFDYYNTQKGEIESGGKNKIAMWMLDTDYDGRSLYPDQVFFPMASGTQGWTRLAKSLNAQIDEERIEAYRGTLSLPFEAGEYRRIAVKIIDDRGIESIKIIALD